MLVIVLSAFLGFSCVAAKPDSLVHEGLTQRIHPERWSMQGYKSRNLLFAQSRAKINAQARRLLQLDSPSQPQLDAILTPQPLLDAAKTGDLAIVRREVAGGADVDTRDPETDDTPLILASANGHTDIMLFLLQEGADINAADNEGFTSLFLAAQEGYDDFVAALINAGADIEAATDRGTTPLMIAAHEGQFSVVEELISAGADVNAKNDKDITALHYAARLSGGSRILTALLDAGADVDAQDEYGTTALHFASYFGQEHNMKVLIDAGADTTLRTVAPSGSQFGLTAEDEICRCMDSLDDADPESQALCHVNSCSDMDDLLALFD